MTLTVAWLLASDKVGLRVSETDDLLEFSQITVCRRHGGEGEGEGDVVEERNTTTKDPR